MLFTSNLDAQEHAWVLKLLETRIKRVAQVQKGKEVTTENENRKSR